MEDQRSSDEINNKIVEIEKDLHSKIECQRIVQESFSDISREILVLRKNIADKLIEKRDLEKVLDTGNYNIRKLTLELKIETNNFWSKKNGGQ